MPSTRCSSAVGAQDGGHQRLRLAALEDGRAVGAGQQADLALDRPQVLGAAAVGPLAVEDQLADDPLLDRAEGGLDPGRGDRRIRRQRAAGAASSPGCSPRLRDRLRCGAADVAPSAGTSSLMIVSSSSLVAAFRSAFITICLVCAELLAVPRVDRLAERIRPALRDARRAAPRPPRPAPSGAR